MRRLDMFPCRSFEVSANPSEFHVDLLRYRALILGWCGGNVGLLRGLQSADQAFLLHGGLLKF